MHSRVVTQIISYPIKSLGGISMSSAKLTQRGLEHDRRWMLVNENNRFLTIREHPEFLDYKVSLHDDGYTVSKKGELDEVVVPFGITEGNELQVKIWDDEVLALTASTNINDWFSFQTGIECKLVYIPENSPRQVQPEWVKVDNHVSFADGYPYLIVGEESVKDINGKVKIDIDYRRFRPNIVFQGGLPYEEFKFEDMSIGTGKLKGIKPCARCIVTTYDPDTGEKSKEPLKTLFQQQINDKMVFGQNAIMTKEGIIRVGDELILESMKPEPYAPVSF